MVAQDSATAWDLKPNRENTNQIFNVLCNVQPVEHPWSGEWHQRETDIIHWSKQQFWFEKCKWLKKAKLYEYRCQGNYVEINPEEEEYTDPLWRWNSNFTDVILFQWYRLFMRRRNLILNPYSTEAKDIKFPTWQKKYEWDESSQTYLVYDETVNVRAVNSWWDWDSGTCDDPIIWETSYNSSSSNLRVNERPDSKLTNEQKTYDKQHRNTYTTWDVIRIYAQLVDTKWCSWDAFNWVDESPIIAIAEFPASECNPDHFIMWYGWIWTPISITVRDATSTDMEEPQLKLAMIYYWWSYFAYLYNTKDEISANWFINISQLWIYVSWLTSPEWASLAMLAELWLPENGYFIPNIDELLTVAKLPEIKDWDKYAVEETIIHNWSLRAFSDYWEIPYFASQWNLYAINWFYTRKDYECNVPTDEELPNVIYYWKTKIKSPCTSRLANYTDKRMFLFTSLVQQASNQYIITWLEKWWARLCYVAWWDFYVSGNGMLNWSFSPSYWDTSRWVFNIPAWITDVKAMYWSLLFFWPKAIYAIANQDALVSWTFINATENLDWYYSPNSYHNDDWEFLIIRRWKLLETLQFSAYYWTVQFTPDTWFFVNWHIKELNNNIDMVSVDASVNHRYISIYDNNNYWPHYSKLLIYDKHYNVWYYWLITWARIVHVKDGIFLWDGIYKNEWRTWWWTDDDTEWGEIIEIISAYVWEEWLQTPKHIQFVKTAIWDHSVITKDSKWDINTSFGWKLYERRNDITVTRYPQLLNSKNSTDPIKSYENGEQIYWHWRLLSHNLLNEIAEYRSYEKFSNTIIREMWWAIDETSVLARFASIKEPVNAPANVLQLCISARHLDNVQFWSFYVWYYLLDADYEDIENTNIDISDLSDRVDEGIVIHEWEYCDEVLAGSACDRPEEA